jgi:hypothetical protein
MAGLAMDFLQVRALFTLDPLMPKLEKLNPIEGLLVNGQPQQRRWPDRQPVVGRARHLRGAGGRRHAGARGRNRPVATVQP